MNNEINHNPANDFPAGPIGAATVHDTEGHLWRRETDTDDTEAHIRVPLLVDAAEDAQGDEVTPQDADDTEGHGRERR